MRALPKAILAALEEQDLESAESLALAHVSTDPEVGPVWAILAVLSAQRGDIAEGLERNQRALDCQPEDAGTWLNHGNLEKLSGRIDKARLAYETARRCDPELCDAVFNLGVLAGEESRTTEAEAYYREALQVDPTYAVASYNLARELSHRKSGKDVHAIEIVELYRSALTQNPLWPDAWRNLGNFLRSQGRDDEAVFAYEQLMQLDPHDKTAAHLLAALRQESPKAADPGYVTRLFDQFATSFDEELSGALNYDGADRLAGIVRTYLSDSAPRILDLGCGTGLFLESLGADAVVATGVDLSSEMLKVARAKGLYQSCEEAEIGEYLESCSSEFDLIAAVDVFIYLGDLARIFMRVAASLAPEGLFAFTIESWPEAIAGDAFELQRSGRYRHSADYLQSLAERSGLTVLRWESGPLRNENAAVVSGEYVVLGRESPIR